MNQRKLRLESDHYKSFIKVMEAELDAKADKTNQAQQMNLLFAYENDFKKKILSMKMKKDIYFDFMDFIINENKNILTCRIYFRERQHTFKDIFPIFKEDKESWRPEMLHPFSINYQFVQWVVERYPRIKRDTKALQAKIESVRKQILAENMPSVIHAARVFWDKMDYSHLQYMDFIQNAAEGFISAIDKFEPPYNKSFGSVVANRMKLFMSEEHNSTLLKIEQHKRRVLYRASKARRKLGLIRDGEHLQISPDEMKAIISFVKESFKNETEDSIREILAASSAASLDKNLFNDEDEGPTQGRTLAGYLASETDVEADVSRYDAMMTSAHAMSELSVFERKVLMLKFGDLDTIFGLSSKECA
jgi:DNA-directed RNA polymerase specialized sigma subunit